jgi:exopolysaccharide production protein ExoQ
MNPSLALFAWFIALVLLLRNDPSKDPEVSPALWVPLAWMSIMGSRQPAQWLGGQAISASDAYEEGNPLDRTVYVILILLAVLILTSRSLRWGEVIGRNVALSVFLLFTLLSVSWSDFPFISFKRWIRDLGGYLMLLVVLSDQRPLEAMQQFVRRLCYLLVPLSIMLIKYYPEMAIGYDEWTGGALYLGVTTSKNMLGVLCLISGLFFYWDTIRRWSGRRERRMRRILLVNAAFIAMTLWLLNLAESATSQACLLVGWVIITVARLRSVRTNPARLKVLIPCGLALYLMLEFGFDLNKIVIEMLGRDPTLTGRTELWSTLGGLDTNPILGTGYESFWLGSRLKAIWLIHPWGPNQAHNGYLEVYLNLGTTGLCLLGAVLVSSYRRICARLSTSPDWASFSLTLWTILLFYDVTEAGFKNPLLWSTFLLGIIAVPAWQKRTDACVNLTSPSPRSRGGFSARRP